MILELGQSLGGTELIRITAEYSNAVLVAVLPYVADVSAKLDLPVPQPVTVAQVSHCSILPQRKVGVEIAIKDGWAFAFESGHIRTVQGPRSFQLIQDPEKIPNYYGKVSVSKTEAVKMARGALTNLGIPPESVFAEQEPKVTAPREYGTNVVPYYYIAWPDPRGGPSVEVEVNADLKRIERLAFRNKSLERPPPKLAATPLPASGNPPLPNINPEYAEKLVPLVLRAVEDYAKKLSLPFSEPMTTNQVRRFSLQENNRGPYVELETTNSWRFLYEHEMVTAYYMPDNFFHSEDRPIQIKGYLGKWNATEGEAIKLVSQALSKLGYSTNHTHIDLSPKVTKPTMSGIPRYMLRWEYSEEGDAMVRSSVMAEVDAGKRELKSLYFGNVAFWTKNPPIDLPLVLPGTNDSKPKPTSQNRGKAPNRPFVPFDAKQ